ncbi:MAG: glycine cleavage system protein GcvH [Candidatus Methanomethyliaceae archaeon]|nr:glycine cleavage system protein GcvH [Candidatus Methanomethyliaceae archaeon]
MNSTIKVGDFIIIEGLLYSKTHEWIAINENPARIGISDYAQKNLHDIVYVELPKIGSFFKKGSTICTLESIKAVAEIYAPVDCIVMEINSKLIDSPELINKDPYGEGWLVKVKIEGGMEDLMDVKAYAEFIKKL